MLVAGVEPVPANPQAIFLRLCSLSLKRQRGECCTLHPQASLGDYSIVIARRTIPMIDVYVTVTEDGKIEHIFAYSQGVGYQPVQATKVNGVDKFTFDIPVVEDKAPTLGIWAVDGIGIGERIGG